MQFPHKFFRDEVREGFYISGSIKRAWAAQLEVLEEIDKICKKHNIRWFADCGTLLGAVRHGGYIPWDDDLDICMLRPDFTRFNQVVKRELPEGYVVLNLHNEGEDFYAEYLTRVTNGHRLNFDEDFLKKYHDCPYATGIDIFPLDYIADDEEEEEQRKALLTLVMAASDEIKDNNENVDDYKDVLAQIEDLCDVKFDYKKCIRQQLFMTGEKLFSLYSKKGGKHVALMPYWVYFNNHKYPAEYFDKTIMMPFEVTELPVPAAFDAVLRIEYGDYMKIHKGGGVHGYPFFTSQEKHLIKNVPEYPFIYEFSPEDLKNDDREVREKPKQQCENMVGLLAEAHAAIVRSMSQGRYEDTFPLFQACQNSAIQIGTMLEEHFGQGFVTVGILEEYCEIIYQVYELAVSAAEEGQGPIDMSGISECMEEILCSIRDSVEKDIPNRREILFMPVYADAWNAFDSVWRKATEDPDCDVYVMPIPYFERTATGAQGEIHYEGELFPEYLNIVDYNSYNLQKRHPDVIFIQNAYDQCNYTTSILPRFYSGNIKKFTDKLVYIPWFKLDEFEEDNEKAYKTMDYFCRVPGIAHADVVIVQSEQMRSKYIEYLTAFAGEDTRSVWESKILGLGTPLDDVGQEKMLAENKKAELEKLPDEWKQVIYKENGEPKRIVLYNTTVAAFMQSGEKLFAKMQSVLDTFKDNRDDIVLLWRPHPLLKSAIVSSKPKLLDSYTAIVEKYNDEKWGIYDDTPELERAIKLCDAYYGDADGVAHKCETLGKPVMIQNVDV